MIRKATHNTMTVKDNAPTMPRMICPSCDKFRYWDWVRDDTNILMGRYTIVKCRTCGLIAAMGRS